MQLPSEIAYSTREELEDDLVASSDDDRHCYLRIGFEIGIDMEYRCSGRVVCSNLCVPWLTLSLVTTAIRTYEPDWRCFRHRPTVIDRCVGYSLRMQI